MISRNQLEELLSRTLTGLGYELVHLEAPHPGGAIRVFIDRPGGVTVEDCAVVSNHLTRLFVAENVDYDRLEVSSPGLDRPLRQLKDFQRFAGERAQVRMRVPVQGRKNFVGILRGTSEAQVKLEVDGTVVCLELEQLDKARLVPNL